ncbi:hypothetical protein [Croceivirga thetidis]|uniref:Tetratricopeptide repeat protein n=1 Tax=Croceivirga thetidis TaxID=2721623 RepID=A0ABX1GT58_9FLAO|nr:hypothetical protein [Croceivirga thetidis]NKI33142.1 hypothetical protein [Croceivirga thetidis]
MRLLLFTILSFLFVQNLRSQEELPKIDYKEVSAKAEKFVESGEYQKVIDELNKINPNDSIYADALLSKSFYALQLKDYPLAMQYAEEGLALPFGENKEAFYQNYGVALINNESYEEAISSFNSALLEFPKNYKLRYNLGVAHEYSGDIKNAVLAYEESIFLNPLYKKPYSQLGGLCAKNGLVSQALLCYNMYLLVSPEGSFSSLKYINDFASAPTEIENKLEGGISNIDGEFEELDLILSSGLALNNDYETGNKIEIALVKQNHALLNQISEVTVENGFWGDKVIPLFKWINDNGYFDLFTYTINYDIQNEKFKAIIEKNEEEIVEFYNAFKKKWIELNQDYLNKTGNNKIIVNGYFDEYFQGIGKLENEKLVGQWEFYNENGSVKSKGEFDSSGQRINNWTWFNADGSINETSTYVNGNLEGPNKGYYPNGKPMFEATYQDDDLNGHYSYFNNKGAQTQSKYFKNGVLDGMYESYFPVGSKIKEYQIPYSDGKIEGEVTQYFITGDTLLNVNFKAGKRHGIETSYFITGNKSGISKYSEGELNGPYLVYYPNGQIKSEGNTKSDYYEGPYTEYYSNGNLKSSYNYDEGVINGLYKVYDRDGKLHYEYEYRKNEVIAYTFFDKDGNIIKEARKKGGEFFYEEYSPFGVKMTEGLYDIKGGKIGEWKYYSNNGVLSATCTYKDNLLDGKYTSYHSSGELLSISHYSENVIDGYYKEFYPNGQLYMQGWYKNGKEFGEWRFYYKDGTMYSKNFYHKGQLHGNQVYFGVEGQPSSTNTYRFGELIKQVYFKSNGQVLQEIDHNAFPADTTLVFYYENKEPQIRTTYSYGVQNGPFMYLDFYGNTLQKGNYLNGEKHGEWITFHENGQVLNKTNYLNGKEHGDYERFNDDGILQEEGIYNLGELSGEWKTYDKKGRLSYTNNYSMGLLHGTRKFYDGPDNLELIRHYEYDRVIGYSYLDSNGTEIAMVPLKNETGNVTSYFQNGKISREMTYKNGVFDGKYLDYYPTGQMESDINYKYGKYHGKRTQFFENGNLELEEVYLMDDLHGPYKAYYQNGKLKEEGNYKNGSKTGVWRYYDESEKKSKEETYFNGAVVTSKQF